MDDIAHFLEVSSDHERKPLRECTKKDILDAMEALQFLGCTSLEERTIIVDTIDASSNKNKFFPKFVDYLKEVTSLFQNVRKIKNLLRDVSQAIVERGLDCQIVADQVHFLFDDIHDSVVGIPFFRAMRSEKGQDGQEEVLELWTIRNTLLTLYFLHDIIMDRILQGSVRSTVTSDLLCDMVFESHQNEVQVHLPCFLVNY